MPRRKTGAAEFIQANAEFVPFVIGDMVEQLGRAAQEWSQAVWAARNGNLDEALKHVVEVDIAIGVFMTVGTSELRSVTRRASNRLDAELPDDEDDASVSE